MPTYPTPEHAIRALAYLNSYRRNLEVLYETPREIPLELPLDRTAARETFRQMATAERSILSEQQSKQLLAAYGIPVTQPVLAASAEAAVAEAARQGYPVVLKIASPDITHKTDVGGVALDLADGAAVATAFARLMSSARASRPTARLEGVTVQRMADRTDGVELILGAKQDPIFGAVVLVGMGGISAELLGDRALELPPLDDTLARRMLESLRLWPLLTGYRGRPPVDVDRLVELLVRFSYLVTDFPELVEIDVNPLWVGPSGALGSMPGWWSIRRDRPAPPGVSAIWRFARTRHVMSARCGWPTARRCCCGRSSPRTSRAGAPALRVVRRNRSGRGFAACSRKRRTTWPCGSAFWITIATCPLWPNCRRTICGS